MCIWFYQICGREIHVIDYYQSYGQPLSHYTGVINSRKVGPSGTTRYQYKAHCLLPTLRARRLAAGPSGGGFSVTREPCHHLPPRISGRWHLRCSGNFGTCLVQQSNHRERHVWSTCLQAFPPRKTSSRLGVSSSLAAHDTACLVSAWSPEYARASIRNLFKRRMREIVLAMAISIRRTRCRPHLQSRWRQLVGLHKFGCAFYQTLAIRSAHANSSPESSAYSVAIARAQLCAMWAVRPPRGSVYGCSHQNPPWLDALLASACPGAGTAMSDSVPAQALRLDRPIWEPLEGLSFRPFRREPMTWR